MTGKEKAAAATGVAILLIAAIFYFTHKDSDTQACGMTATAVPLFVEALSRGHENASITVKGIAGVLTVPACTAALQHLQAHPDTPVPLDLHTDDGTVSRSVTAPDLTEPPPPPAPAPASTVSPLTLLKCRLTYPARNQSILLAFCYHGLIPPHA